MVKLLLEAGQVIPDFLEQYKPEGDLTWDDDVSEDGEAAGVDVAGDDGGWGATEPTEAPVEAPAATENAGDAWGPGGSGWGAAANTAPAVEAW